MLKSLKYFCSALLALFLIQGTGAQSEGEKTVLWKIEGNNLSSPSYLFGTMHIIPKPSFENYKIADALLESSDLLVLEMEMDVSTKQKIEWTKLMLLPDGGNIADFTDSTEFNRIRNYATDSLKVKDFFFNAYTKFKPFAFYSALIPHAIGKNIEGYELHYSKIAKNNDIPVYGLETFEYQMAIFDSIPNQKQMEMFFPENLDLKKEMQEMLELYMSHDIYSMASLVTEDNDPYAEFENELLHMRNNNWAEKLEQLMSEQSCFVAVGAAHLAGEQGLIRLFREKGFKVVPICLIDDCETSIK